MCISPVDFWELDIFYNMKINHNLHGHFVD